MNNEKQIQFYHLNLLTYELELEVLGVHGVGINCVISMDQMDKDMYNSHFI